MARKKNNQKKKGKSGSRKTTKSTGNANKKSSGSLPDQTSRLPIGLIGLVAIIIIGVILVLMLPGWLADDDSSEDGNRLSTNQQNNETADDDPERQQPVSREESWKQMDNAEDDGWHTEVFSDHALAKLKKLGKLIVDPTKLDEAHVADIVADEFTSSSLVPTPDNREVVFDDGKVVVERALDPWIQTLHPPPDKSASRLVEVLQEVARPFENAKDVRFKFKLYRVLPDEKSVATLQYFSITGKTESGILEQNATWRSTWDLGDASLTDAVPKLADLSLQQFEQVLVVDDEALFSDCTESILQNNPSYREHLVRGYNHWLNLTESRPYWERLGTPGIAVGDANGDGLDDVYLCQERGIPNRLYLQNDDGTVRDASARAGVDWLEDSRGALFVDLDNDGDQELVVSVSGGVVVAENDGQANFKIRTVLKSFDDTKSLCAADYDQDGKLDLYVTVYYPNVFDGEMEVSGVAAANAHQVLYDSNRGGGNSLFKNKIDGDTWEFEDVTKAVGLDVNNARYSLAAAWEDYDNDGDQDLYIANDYGRNNLYRNDDGMFTDVSEATGTEDYNFAMSAAWGDYDRDGMMDIYIGNMFSSAGNRITFQKQFKEGSTQEEKNRFHHLARGNTLFKNVDGTRFDDVTDGSGVAMGRWAWSTNFVDLNNDAWQDLIIANGMITTEDTGDC